MPSVLHAELVLSQQFNETTILPENSGINSCSDMPYLCMNIVTLRLPLTLL